MNFLCRVITPGCRPGRAAVAGLIATIVYSIVMQGDMALTGNRFSDVRFIEGILEGKPTAQKRFPALAWTMHLLNGVLLAELYAAIFKRFLPGPNWLKGVLFGEIFTVAAWSVTPLVDKYHPMIQSGELPRLVNWTSFLQNLGRHLSFGVTLGLLYRD
jgi:hypothetical protein